MLVRYCDVTDCSAVIRENEERLVEVTKFINGIGGQRETKPDMRPLEICVNCNEKLRKFITNGMK